jgi:hypothetical protein
MRFPIHITLLAAFGIMCTSCLVNDPGGGKIQVDALPIQKDCKWGFMGKDGNFIVPPRFDEVGEFFDEWAKVRSGRKWGFINTEGKLVIDTMYSQAEDMVNGYARVVWNGRAGFIDQRNSFTASPGDDLLSFAMENTGSVTFSEGLAIVRLDQKYGFINTSGKFTIAPSYKDALPFVDGSAWVESDNGFWTYINKANQPAFDPQYQGAGDFSEGLAAVEIGGKWGFLKKPNQLVIYTKYDEVGDFHEGRAAVLRDSLVGYIDAKGVEVIVPHFYSAWGFSEGLAAVEGLDQKWSFIRSDGRPAFSGSYDWVTSFRGGYARFAYKINDATGMHYKYGLLNKDGTFAVQPEQSVQSCAVPDTSDPG